MLREDTVIDIDATDLQALQAAMQAFAPALHLVPREGGLRVSGKVKAEDLNRYCFEKGLTLSLLHTHKRDLESRFLEITDE